MISGDVDRNGIKEWYFYKVSDIKNFLDSKIDGTYKKIGSMSEIAGKKGIICYGDCNWSEATSHVDVWDGNKVLWADERDYGSDIYIYIRNKIYF